MPDFLWFIMVGTAMVGLVVQMVIYCCASNMRLMVLGCRIGIVSIYFFLCCYIAPMPLLEGQWSVYNFVYSVLILITMALVIENMLAFFDPDFKLPNIYGLKEG